MARHLYANFQFRKLTLEPGVTLHMVTSSSPFPLMPPGSLPHAMPRRCVPLSDSSSSLKTPKSKCFLLFTSEKKSQAADSGIGTGVHLAMHKEEENKPKKSDSSTDHKDKKGSMWKHGTSALIEPRRFKVNLQDNAEILLLLLSEEHAKT